MPWLDFLAGPVQADMLPTTHTVSAPLWCCCRSAASHGFCTECSMPLDICSFAALNVNLANRKHQRVAYACQLLCNTVQTHSCLQQRTTNASGRRRQHKLLHTIEASSTVAAPSACQHNQQDEVVPHPLRGQQAMARTTDGHKPNKITACLTDSPLLTHTACLLTHLPTPDCQHHTDH